MANEDVGPDQPRGDAVPADPALLPDVAAEPHPFPHGSTQPGAAAPGVGQGQLEELMPDITRLAQKVGGFRRLAEIARQLDRGQ
jgi:hypothetical protein